jgi:glycine oxidase
MPHIVIVGGGVIGCSCAYFLAKAGAEVTLLERGEVAGEASGASAGLLTALSEEGDKGPEFLRLWQESLAVYEEVLPELAKTGIDVRYRRSGILRVALSDEEGAQLRQLFQVRKAEYPDDLWLEAKELRSAEPQLDADAVGGILSPTEAYLNPKNLVLAFAAAAGQYGADIRPGRAVEQLETSAGRVVAARTARSRHEADAFLLAGGSWAGELGAQLDVSIPVHPIRGQMFSVRAPAEPLQHVIWGMRGYLVPREDGQTFVGATLEDVGFDKSNTPEALDRLRLAGEELVPALKGGEVVRAWAGLRPASRDGLPILGPLPGYENAWVAAGHYRNGILLAPVTGKVMAEAILSGSMPEHLGPFSPARFAKE